MRSAFILFSFTFALFTAQFGVAKEVSFNAADGLEITAELEQGSSDTMLVLFHQAGSSRGEYATISPRLNALGYGTLSVDQRSGGGFGNISNKTAQRASALGKADGYLDARVDMEAAISYARRLPGVKRVVIWGSSYSAALALVIAGEQKPSVDGVLSFSPGEYLSGVSVEKAAKGINVPTFITAAKSETGQWRTIHKAIPASANAVGFSPKGRGRHGSSSLIAERSSNFEEYWQAVEAFLQASF